MPGYLSTILRFPCVHVLTYNGRSWAPPYPSCAAEPWEQILGNLRDRREHCGQATRCTACVIYAALRWSVQTTTEIPSGKFQLFLLLLSCMKRNNPCLLEINVCGFHGTLLLMNYYPYELDTKIHVWIDMKCVLNKTR